MVRCANRPLLCLPKNHDFCALFPPRFSSSFPGSPQTPASVVPPVHCGVRVPRQVPRQVLWPQAELVLDGERKRVVPQLQGA